MSLRFSHLRWEWMAVTSHRGKQWALEGRKMLCKTDPTRQLMAGELSEVIVWWVCLIDAGLYAGM